jgi:hypothetical protein
MSSRAFKKSSATQSENHFEEFSDDIEIEEPVRKSIFDQLLFTEDEADQELEDQSESSTESSIEVETKSSIRNTKKEPKSISKKQKVVDDFDLEELEGLQIDKMEEVKPDIQDFFIIDKAFLDAEQEIKEKISGLRKNSQKSIKRKGQYGLVASPFLKEWGSCGVNGIHFDDTNRISCTQEFDFTTRELQHLVEIGDVEGILELTRKNPNHIETLLICSDILKHHSTDRAAALVAKTVYLLSKCLNFFDPLLSLDYKLNELNRFVHLSLFRHLQFLIKKGCWRTSFQIAKALYRIDKSDPLCVVLILEFLGLQIEDNDFIQNAPIKDLLFWTPGFNLGKLFINFDESKFHSFLTDFPEAFYSFCEIFQLNVTKSEKFSLRMYYKNFFSIWSVCYSGQLWKNHSQKSKIIKSLKEFIPISKPEIKLTEAHLGLYRHQVLIASDYQQQLKLGFPQELLSAPILLTNPFPPFDEWK